MPSYRDALLGQFDEDDQQTRRSTLGSMAAPGLTAPIDGRDLTLDVVNETTSGSTGPVEGRDYWTSGSGGSGGETKTPKFNLEGAQVNNRAADLKDLHDLTVLSFQQPGFGGVANNDAVRAHWTNILQPLLKQQGIDADLMEHDRLDKYRTKDGRVVDFVLEAGGANPRGGAIIEDGSGGGGAPAMGAMGAGSPFGGVDTGGLDALLTGDPQSAIRAALQQYSGPSANLQALLRQLQG